MSKGFEQTTYQDKITEFLHLYSGLEMQLKFTTFDDDIREIQQMDFKGIYQEMCECQ